MTKPVYNGIVYQKEDGSKYQKDINEMCVRYIIISSDQN